MAYMDLLSYERDSRWMPHLGWNFSDWNLQEKMEQQALQREQTWQRIADKLGSLLITEAGCSFGQSDYIVRDIEDQDYLDRAYEKAPLLTTQIVNNKLVTVAPSLATTPTNSLLTAHHNQQEIALPKPHLELTTSKNSNWLSIFCCSAQRDIEEEVSE